MLTKEQQEMFREAFRTLEEHQVGDRLLFPTLEKVLDSVKLERLAESAAHLRSETAKQQ